MSDSNVYTAEKILEKREHRGVTQYLIKWKGYSRRESTWEPVENILDPELLTSFVNSRKNKKLRKSRSSHAPPTLPDTATSPLLPEPSKPESTSVEVQVEPQASLPDASPEKESPSEPQAPSPGASPEPELPSELPAPSPDAPPKRVVPTPTASPKVVPVTSPKAEPLSQKTPPKPKPNHVALAPQPRAPSPLPVSTPKPSRKRFAVMNTVITDVTVNNLTITISESKSCQFFFKEVSRRSFDATTQI